MFNEAKAKRVINREALELKSDDGAKAASVMVSRGTSAGKVSFKI
jgi:hypothetical protein